MMQLDEVIDLPFACKVGVSVLKGSVLYNTTTQRKETNLDDLNLKKRNT